MDAQPASRDPFRELNLQATLEALLINERLFLERIWTRMAHEATSDEFELLRAHRERTSRVIDALQVALDVARRAEPLRAPMLTGCEFCHGSGRIPVYGDGIAFEAACPRGCVPEELAEAHHG